MKTEELISHIEKGQNHPIALEFRSVTFNDWETLLKWRNDEMTRSNSFTSEPLSENEHKAWLEKSLNNSNRGIFIVQDGKEEVGTVRFDIFESKDHREISWTVAPDHRGKGYGKLMVKKFTDLIGGKQIARIKDENIGSVKIAEHAGMHLIEDENGALLYTNY